MEQLADSNARGLPGWALQPQPPQLIRAMPLVHPEAEGSQLPGESYSVIPVSPDMAPLRQQVGTMQQRQGGGGGGHQASTLDASEGFRSAEEAVRHYRRIENHLRAQLSATQQQLQESLAAQEEALSEGHHLAMDRLSAEYRKQIDGLIAEAQEKRAEEVDFEAAELEHLDALQVMKVQLVAARDEHQQELAALQQQVEDLKGQVPALPEELQRRLAEDAKEEMSAMQAQHEALVEELGQRNEVKLAAAVASQQHMEEQYEAQQYEAQQRIDELEQQYEAQVARQVALEAQHLAKVAELQQEARAAAQEALDAAAQVAEKVKEGERQVEERLESAVREAKERQAEVEAQAQEALEAQGRLSWENEALQRQVEAAQQQLDELQQQLSQQQQVDVQEPQQQPQQRQQPGEVSSGTEQVGVWRDSALCCLDHKLKLKVTPAIACLSSSCFCPPLPTYPLLVERRGAAADAALLSVLFAVDELAEQLQKAQAELRAVRADLKQSHAQATTLQEALSGQARQAGVQVRSSQRLDTALVLERLNEELEQLKQQSRLEQELQQHEVGGGGGGQRTRVA